MSYKLSKKLRGDRKFFAIVFFILLIIFLSGILTPLRVHYQESNWNRELSKKIEAIRGEVLTLFSKKEDKLLETSQSLKKDLSHILVPRNISYGSLIKALNENKYDDYSIEILAPNGKLIAWNRTVAVPANDILPLAYPAGETHFFNTELKTYLTVTDTILVENDQFYLVVSRLIEKHFELQNRYFEDINFTKEISNRFLTQFDVDYTPFSDVSRDGRKFSFELLNNKGNKIGLVTFTKPSLDSEVNSVYTFSSSLQSILSAVAFIFLGFGFRKEFRGIKKRTYKILLLTLYFASFRMLLYFVGFPSNILHGELVDPAYFSSTFGGGLVKSPAEFFITSFFLIIITAKGFAYLSNYVSDIHKKSVKNYILFSFLLLPSAFIYLLTIRGLSASVKSVVFDSTLHYFKEPNLIPNLPSLVMNLNVLIFTVSALMLLSSIVILLLTLLPAINNKRTNNIFLALFAVFQVLGFVFIKAQRDPLINPLLGFIFISLIFLLVYRVYNGRTDRIYNYVYITLAASVISITLMNYFNIELEKASLKTTALEINRPNNNLLKFLISETLNNAAGNRDVINDFYIHRTNFEAEAFRLWASSSLQKESLASSVTIYDEHFRVLGEFSVGMENQPHILEQLRLAIKNGSGILQISQSGDTLSKLYAGLAPVTDRGQTLGYIAASISFSLQNLGAQNIPDFLESKKNIINSVLDVGQLKIFQFYNSKLKEVYGDIYPSRDQTKPIFKAKYSQDNEAWLELSLNGEKYYTYLLKTSANGNEIITAVSTQVKRISWDLFNFFKIFLIHSIFIILLFSFLLIIKLRELKYSFRTQLLVAFLFVSIIPVIILAVYNRHIVQQRSQTAIFNELSERTKYIENIINEELEETKNINYHQAFVNAGKDLGISFAIYDGADQIFISKPQFQRSGLFNQRLNPEVYYEMNYLSYREYLVREKFDNFVYDAYYRKVTINGQNVIIEVNDAFNKVRLTFSIIDVDIFLFGVYSFATIIMILLSTILANRISRPIRKLTKATGSVAHGDFNIVLDNNEKGELKELLEGFNSMTKELQKNQIDLAELERENAWKEMAKQVAHEIKNPLTPMKLAVQQLIVSYKDKTKNFDTVFEKLSSTLLTQIENLRVIASEFSRFARMPNFKLEELDIIPVIEDTINLFLEENIKISFQSELNSASIEGDNAQLHRLLINFIRNSIQADAKNIFIKLHAGQDNFILEIEDDGKGIPESISGRIFEANFTTKERGMGLGLKLAKRFIEGINGSITLEKKSEPGALFRITVPILHNEKNG